MNRIQPKERLPPSGNTRRKADGTCCKTASEHPSAEQPHSAFRRYGVTAIVASGLRQQSLRGYDNRRFGVTAIVASGLRQKHPFNNYFNNNLNSN
ncbi:hypothetical protein O3689_13005 [Prevotella nigrescens]|uniref:hypothetical protein n=1 Tax=Prevotella nigrescens TaxID=28133 RepID=UPI00352FE31F